MHKIPCARVTARMLAAAFGGELAEGTADDGDEADAVTRRAAEVLGEREPAVRGADLARARLPAQLEPALVDHPQAARPDRVAEALQPPVRVHRQVSVPVVDTVELIAPGHPS